VIRLPVRTEKVTVRTTSEVNHRERRRQETERLGKVWNSLEVAKLVVSTLTPLTIGLSAAYLGRETARQQALITQLNRQQDKLQDFWEKKGAAVNELAGFGLKGEEITPAQKDRMEILEMDLQDARIVYGPFLPNDVDLKLAKLTADAATFEDKPNDTTGWELFSDGVQVARQLVPH
jgi:hypothetical protein